MQRTVNVAIHPSQFPQKVTEDLLDCLRTRRVHHKFLYETHKQSQKWLAVHQAHSPMKHDASFAAAYDSSFRSVAQRVPPSPLHVIGLGCGSGEKDARLLQMLKKRFEVTYFPVDVSLPLVLAANHAAAEVLGDRPSSNGDSQMSGFVCDLSFTEDLVGALGQPRPGEARLLTFFGMIPNFEPEAVLPKLSVLLRPNDFLLLSANLAPDDDLEAAIRHILPQYDNVLTGDWLLSFLYDLGAQTEDGVLEWLVRKSSNGHDLFRLEATFRFVRPCVLRAAEQAFDFHPGETIRLFFSYRYTSAGVRALLARFGLLVQDQWITDSKEEGIFLCVKDCKG